MAKTVNYETKEYLTEPRVPEIYFKQPNKPMEDNVTKAYLPEEVRAMALRKPTIVGKVMPTPAAGEGGRAGAAGRVGGYRTVLQRGRVRDFFYNHRSPIIGQIS